MLLLVIWTPSHISVVHPKSHRSTSRMLSNIASIPQMAESVVLLLLSSACIALDVHWLLHIGSTIIGRKCSGSEQALYAVNRLCSRKCGPMTPCVVICFIGTSCVFTTSFVILTDRILQVRTRDQSRSPPHRAYHPGARHSSVSSDDAMYLRHELVSRSCRRRRNSDTPTSRARGHRWVVFREGTGG